MALNSIYYVLSSADFWPDKPKFPSVILFSGTFFLLSLIIYIPKDLREINCPSLSLTILIILISYMLFLPSAYPPRWSTHLLPFSVLGFIYLVYFINMKFFTYK